MTLKRLAAFADAVALVAGALWLRGALDDKSDGNSDGSTAGDEPTNRDTYQLICSTEFKAVCESIADDDVDVMIESAGTTLARLAEAEDRDLPDAWITLDPFPAMLDETRDRTTSFGPATQRTDPIAVTTAAVAVADAKADALRGACGAESIATCVGRLAGQPWADLGATGIQGPVKPGITDPATEAAGLISFANGVAGIVGSIDIDAGRFSDSDVRAWVRNLADNSQSLTAGSPLGTMISRPSSVDVAFSTVAETVGNPSGARQPYQTFAVEPAFQLNAVFAVLDGDDDGLRSQVQSALVTAGWEQPSADSTSLPASTFINLRNLWESN